MIRFSKSALLGLATIATLGIIGGLIFRQDFVEKGAVGVSSESTEKKGAKTQLSKVRTDKRSPANKAEALEGISDDLTPAKASLLLEDFKAKHPGNSERIAYASAIIKKLCELGYTQEVWDLIEKGPGGIRDNQIISFYENVNLSDNELLGKISGSPLSEIHVSFIGFMSRFTPEQYEKVVESSDFRNFLGELDKLSAKEAAVVKNNISSGLGHSITVSLYENPDKIKDLLKIAARLNSAGILDTSRFMDLASRFGRSDPFENWALVSALKPEPDGRVGQLRSNMIRDMLEVDAPKAISEVLYNQNPAKASDINAAVESWVNIDSNGAADWFQQKRSTLSPQDRDAIAAAFSSYAGDHSEFSGAREWAEQIQNQTLKAEMIKKITEAAAAKEEGTNGTR